jgi:hypothetical protein
MTGLMEGHMVNPMNDPLGREHALAKQVSGR